MGITIKNIEEIEAMKIAGRITACALEVARQAIRPGITTAELDRLCEEYIRDMKAKPSFKGYYGYPASICASVNDVVIHGIPSDYALKDGDIISIDVGAYIGGYHGDAARTFAVGQISDEDKRLIEVTRQSFYEGIKFAREGNYLNDVSSAIQKYVEANGFSVVRDYVGHGIGKQMHEAPNVPNFKTIRKGPRLTAGMTLAIEPMVNIGTYRVKQLGDGWTVVTGDGRKAAHYENTVLITSDAPQLLTCI